MNYFIFILIIGLTYSTKTDCSKKDISDGINTLCGNRLCDNIGGICIKEMDYQKCSCYYNYTTYGEVLCSYKKYSSKTAFLLELILPIGIGHIYSLRYANAIVKLSLFIIIIRMKNKNLSQIATLIFSLMCIIDLIGFISGFYKDGNKLPFY